MRNIKKRLRKENRKDEYELVHTDLLVINPCFCIFAVFYGH